MSGPYHPRDAALYLAGLGYPNFRVKPGRKDPATPNGFYDATTDPQIIRREFRHGDNIGTPGTPDVLILDVDVPKDARPLKERQAEARAVLAMLEDTFPEVAAAPLVGTPSGGFHVYLRLPPGAPRIPTGKWPR